MDEEVEEEQDEFMEHAHLARGEVERQAVLDDARRVNGDVWTVTGLLGRGA